MTSEVSAFDMTAIDIADVPGEIMHVVDTPSCERALKYLAWMEIQDDVDEKLKKLANHDFVEFGLDVLKDNTDMSFDSLNRMLTKLLKIEESHLRDLTINVVTHLLTTYSEASLTEQMTANGNTYYGLDLSSSDEEEEDEGHLELERLLDEVKVFAQ
jgi:hypothetical protein